MKIRIHKCIYNSQLANVGKVGEGGLLGADAVDLRRLHDELPLLAGHHVRILLAHDVDHARQQLVVCVVALGTLPRADVVALRQQLLLLLLPVRIKIRILELEHDIHCYVH